MVTTLVSSVAGGLLGAAIGSWPLVSVRTGNRRVLSAVAAVPKPEKPPTPGELSPLELGYLVGGSTRMGEVALMDLFLAGRIRREAESGTFVLVGPSTPSTGEKDPIRRELVQAFKGRTGLSALGLVRAATFPKGIAWVREQLAERRLLAQAPELPETLADRQDAGMIAAGLTFLGILTTVAGIALEVLPEVGGWALFVLFLGIVLAVTSGIAWFHYAEEDGKNISTLTRVGKDVAREAEEAYEIREAEGRAMDRETALRYTAVVGLGVMGRQVPPRAFGQEASSDTTPRTVILYGEGDGRDGSEPVSHDSGGDGSGEGGELPEFGWDALCRFAGACNVDGGASGGDGGGTGGDGGGGGGGDGGGGGGGS
ncbi:TIGR04222 domain-containing membrane protein [Nocardiopsis nanhaiensis]